MVLNAATTGTETRSPRAIFVQRFNDLYAAAGNPTLRRLAANVETRMRAAQGNRPIGAASAQRISAWKKGENVPARFESLLPVVLTLTELARKAGKPLPRELADPQQWRQVWEAATTWTPEDEGESPCPYRGLKAFGRDDHALFFGRTRSTTELTSLVRTATGIVAVVGASGAGKSSLLAAGLVPALSDWCTTTLTPGPHPVSALATALEPFPAPDTSPDPADRPGAPEEPAEPGTPQPKTADALVPVKTTAPTAGGDLARRLLIVDQFEELFTTCASESEREEFLGSLHELATRTENPCTVVIALRADFFAHCLNYRVLQESLEQRSYLLGPMRLDELSQAISGPAGAAGLELEPGLEELVITELCGVGDHHDRRDYDPGTLPLLSHVMAATWQYREARKLTVAGYRKAGGVVGSVAATADQVWQELAESQRSAAKDILLDLISVSQDGRDTRRPAERSKLLSRAADPEESAAALELLSRSRLITLDANAVTLTHEIILTAWPRLRGWIDEDRVGYLVRQRVAADAADWAAQERDSSLLYRGVRLHNAIDNADPRSSGPLTTEFLAYSTAARTRTRRRASRTKAILATLGVALLVLSFAAYTQYQLVSRQNADKDFADILNQADLVRGADPALAAQLDLIAHRTRPTEQSARSRLLETQNSPLATVTTAHTEAVRQIEHRSDRGVLASLTYGGEVKLWDTSDPQNPNPLGDKLDGVFGTMAFSPDGKLLATTSDEEAARATVTLWDVSTPETPRSLSTFSGIEPDQGTAHVAFTPDGRTLATRTGKWLTLWSIARPTAPSAGPSQRLAEPGDPASATSIRISPNGRLLALATGAFEKESSIQLWDIADTARLTLLAPSVGGPVDPAPHFEFSSDSGLLAVSGRATVGPAAKEPTVDLWDVTVPARPRQHTSLKPDLGRIFALRFAPEGRVLALGSAEGAMLWSLTDPEHPTPLTNTISTSPSACHRERVCETGTTALDFGVSGRTLVAGGSNGDLRVWSLPPAILAGPTGSLSLPSYNAAGGRMAIASSDSGIYLWDLRDPGSPAMISHYRMSPANRSIALSPDGNALLVRTLSIGHNQSLFYPVGATRPLLFDVSDTKNIRQIAEWQLPSALPLSPLSDLTISGNWRRVATHTADRKVQLWDLTDRTRPAPIGAPLPISSNNVGLSFDTEGNRLLANELTADGEFVVTLWNLTDPSHPQRVELARIVDGRSYWVVGTPDDSTLILVSGGSIQSLDISDPTRPVQLSEPLTVHPRAIGSINFTPDAKNMITNSGDIVQIWDFTDPAHPEPQEKLTGPGAYWGVTLHPDGHRLILTGQDGFVRLWDLDIRRSVDRICEVSGGIWTEELWRRYLPSRLPYEPPCP
ncbi:nSTAND1 domain-containing NTPase [Nocardia sp. NPDC055321]